VLSVKEKVLKSHIISTCYIHIVIISAKEKKNLLQSQEGAVARYKVCVCVL